ncbi:hypothetical protein AN639_02025 [Candidatus Epulonipiscium fishelsonii]|nr:hypothetical protein AN639_02025 [Epulopiscium sp. SCG-B05WGA-EpuloA1]
MTQKIPFPMPIKAILILEEGQYWRGGVWAPTNYMVLKGIETYGYNDLAFKIARLHLESVKIKFIKRKEHYGNYCPTKDERGEIHPNPILGWRGLSPISILVEFVLGIKIDYVKIIKLWGINLLERNMAFATPYLENNLSTLKCEARNNLNDEHQKFLLKGKEGKVKFFWNDNQKKLLLKTKKKKCRAIT